MSAIGLWAITVTDLNLAAWYAECFDLTVMARFEAPDDSRVVVLRGQDLMLELKQRDRHVDRSPTADGYFKVGWFVPSVTEALNRVGGVSLRTHQPRSAHSG